MDYRKFNNPYWYQIIALTILAGYNIFFNLFYLPQVVVSVAVSGFLDFLIKYKKHKVKVLPKSGIITGLLIGTILGRAEIYVFVIAPLIAIIFKNVIKWRGNIFNPAALAILLSIYLFSVPDIWWASGPMILAFISGYLVSDKIKRISASFSLIISFTLLILIQDIVRQSFSFASIIPVFLSSPFFLAFFMLTDPATSPSSKRGQIYFGILTGLISFIFLKLGIPGFLLAALLLSNLAYNLSKNIHRKA